jgi:hypothetical protein
MKDERRIDPYHSQIQGLLRTVGPVVLGVGLVFTAVGLISFFQAIGSFEPPRYFWCVFVGLPLTGVGAVLCKLGYLGAINRYVMGEFAPVQKDTFNVLAQGTRPGVETLARALGQGFAAGAGTDAGADRGVPCSRCATSNEASARFCSQCGASLENQNCPGCGQSNAPDDQFCGHCGERLA